VANCVECRRDTGFVTFTPGNNVYGLISNSVTAPMAATSATIYFHCAGSAAPSQSATIDLTTSHSERQFRAGSPTVTNVLAWPPCRSPTSLAKHLRRSVLPPNTHKSGGSLDRQPSGNRGRWHHQINHVSDDEPATFVRLRTPRLLCCRNKSAPVPLAPRRDRCGVDASLSPG